MASILDKVLGEMLYAPFDSSRCEKYCHRYLTESDLLPSPEELKGLVLIKGKRPNKDHESDDFDEEEEDDYKDDKVPTTDEGVDHKKIQQSSKTAKELGILTMFHGYKFKDIFWVSSIGLPPSHMHSISEMKKNKIFSRGFEYSSGWRQFNKAHMSRTYPGGLRVNSSNDNPMLAWSVGCQMVALNFQVPNTALYLNDGRFRQNGQCGYILKPASLLHTIPVEERCKPAVLKVCILKGSYLPKLKGARKGSMIYPYIQIKVHNVLVKKGKKILQTQTKVTSVKKNGFNPIWNDDTFEFKVYSPDVAMLQVQVLSSAAATSMDRIFQVVSDIDTISPDRVQELTIGFCTIPLSSLRNGFRSISIQNTKGLRTGAYSFPVLLAKFQVSYPSKN
mmetsp:Transcript_31885/g.73392  ORF Transcript_31885/g.73392 Transcript_31885/m.73392 type:complete len:391 (-) Transcript_31885:49-1221(-)